MRVKDAIAALLLQDQESEVVVKVSKTRAVDFEFVDSGFAELNEETCKYKVVEEENILDHDMANEVVILS